MSESLEVDLLLGVTAGLFLVGVFLAQTGEEDAADAPARHLLRRDTQFTDRQLVRQTLKQMGIAYKEGDPERFWGAEGIELQVFDAAGRPWMAFAWDDAKQRYAIYSQAPDTPDDDLPEELRLSDEDPLSILGQLAQQYGYLKTMQALLQDGYKVKDSAEQRSDGTRVIVLEKLDPESGETLTVRLLFGAREGKATILTDSRREDGTHGVCPDMDTVLDSMGIQDYDKWVSPAAQQARQAAEERKAAKPARPADGQQKQTPQQRRGEV